MLLMFGTLNYLSNLWNFDNFNVKSINYSIKRKIKKYYSYKKRKYKEKQGKTRTNKDKQGWTRMNKNKQEKKEKKDKYGWKKIQDKQE